MKSNIKALIFDFDGLLVNTEELIHMAYDEFFKRRNKVLEAGDQIKMMGHLGQDNMKFLKEKYNLGGDPEDLLVERRAIAKVLFDDRMALMEGAEELLDLAQKLGLKCAIASGGTKKIIDPALKRFGIEGNFMAVVAEEDLVQSRGKPDPEVFLIAAKKLGVEPKNCLVLEDSVNGVLAAKAGGMKVIFIPDIRFTKKYPEGANLILKSLREVNEKIMRSLVT